MTENQRNSTLPDFGDTLGDRNDRYFVVSKSEPHRYFSSLRESAYDKKPIDKDEAVRRFNEQIQNPDLVLIEVRIVAEKQPTDAPLKLVVR